MGRMCMCIVFFEKKEYIVFVELKLIVVDRKPGWHFSFLQSARYLAFIASLEGKEDGVTYSSMQRGTVQNRLFFIPCITKRNSIVNIRVLHTSVRIHDQT
jgi:hypothetical protein